ncbi:hypothetical protein PV327_008518 [Microctonus hyperodae]|uniref:Uncharacterized protein n=1 Tax=Microctonus hyperodae TaxID=165561 RepID=A0AA39F3C1_MICHY|nr:hypothetical protein PV327_008518 [Microctonus hyperodae]
METTTGHKLNQSRQIEESFGNVISCSHQIASDSTVDDSPTPEGRYHHCRHQYDIGTNVMSRAETDPYRELEIYLARVIEEIDDIIVTLPSESLIKTSKEFPTNQQQPHYHKLTNKQKPPYVHVKSCIDKSHINSTDTSKSLNTLSLLQISRKSKSTTSFASSSALPIKNATVQVTAFYPPSNTTEAPAQYRDLSNEFSIVDCDNIRRNSKINKLAMIPMVQKEITSHLENRLSNYDCDKSKDTILSFKSQQKFDNPPRVVFSSKTQRQCNAKESKYDRSIHLSDQNIRFLKNNSSLPVNLNFSRLKYARLKRCQFIYVEPKKTISLSSNLFNAEKTFEETLTANLVDKFSYQFNHDKSHSCKNKMLYSPLSEKICQLSNGSLNNGAIGILKDNFESDYSYVFVEDNHIIMAGTNLLDGGVLKSISREDNGTQSSAFRKIISKQEALINGDIISNAVLFNVSSLSDQHLLDIFNEQTGDSKFQTSTYSMSTVKNDKKSVSPLILKSDITAERISKSDNDKSKINPFLLKTFSNIQQNNVGEKCDVSRQLKEFFDSNVESQKFKEIEIHDIKMLGADPNTGSQSLPISISSLLSQVRNGSGSCCLNTPPISPVSSDIATQTTPIISRSWRFTWVNDCESHRAQSHLVSHALHDESLTYNVPLKEAINEDNRLSSSSSSSSSPQDHLRSMDEISWDSISLDTTDKASPSESDIGTASLPKSPGGRLVEPLTSSKYNREETWQHINRRSSNLNPCGGNGITDVWIRRESVHTQTVTKNINNNNNDDDDGDDDDYEIINNNNYDNVRGSQEAVDKRSNVIDDISRNLKMTVSSSLSSEMIEDLLRVPFSPSTMSLRQKDEPNMMEFCGKSHSAPLLENNSPKKNTTNQFVHSPRSQSERHLSEIEAQEACKWLRAAGFPHLTTLVIITRSVQVGDDAKMRCRYCIDGELHEGEDEGLVERYSASTTQGIIDENEIKSAAL